MQGDNKMGKSIIVGPVLLVFEALKKPRKSKNQDGSDRIKWECTIAFPPGSQAHAVMAPLEQEARLEKFGATYAGPYRSPFRDDQARDLFDLQNGIQDPNGANAWRQKSPVLRGMIAVNLKSNDPITPYHSVDGKSAPMTEEQTKRLFYPGCEVYVEVNAYAYSQPGQTPGVSFGLNSIFKHADGTPLISVSDGARAFAEIAANPMYAQQAAQRGATAATMPGAIPYPGLPQFPQQVPPVQQPAYAMQSAPAGAPNPYQQMTPQVPQRVQMPAQQPQQAPPPPPPIPQPQQDPAYLAWLAQQERERAQGQAVAYQQGPFGF